MRARASARRDNRCTAADRRGRARTARRPRRRAPRPRRWPTAQLCGSRATRCASVRRTLARRKCRRRAAAQLDLAILTTPSTPCRAHTHTPRSVARVTRRRRDTAEVRVREPDGPSLSRTPSASGCAPRQQSGRWYSVQPGCSAARGALRAAARAARVARCRARVASCEPRRCCTWYVACMLYSYVACMLYGACELHAATYAPLGGELHRPKPEHRRTDAHDHARSHRPRLARVPAPGDAALRQPLATRRHEQRLQYPGVRSNESAG